ncbi:2-C-methyl-D-erythritol 4-phosphatecytidylyltransferase [Striga asiatica]|uniref:2-C-methyl-D-erythritol 4-phosphatecytidylyltransferase n=1 Tax=Striga asiatica TaxID=4170 RepID=A0A5A7QNM4_STRAF|nr:2-C-methyl-D-erythritol 4-phosphatecytidylyltransferase [Striga asiatica]
MGESLGARRDIVGHDACRERDVAAEETMNQATKTRDGLVFGFCLNWTGSARLGPTRLRCRGSRFGSRARIERFLIWPAIEKIVVGCYWRPGKSGHWRDLFASLGVSQVGFSDIVGPIGDCVVRRPSIRGFMWRLGGPNLLVLC